MVKEKQINEALEELKHIPTGKDFSDLDTLYKTIPSNQLDSYIHAFDRKLSAGYNGQGKDCYGKGVYLTFNLESAISLAGRWNYGDCIIMVKLLGGFKNYVFFNADRNSLIRDLLIKTYGKPLDVYGQLLAITGDEQIARQYATSSADYFGNHCLSEIRRRGYNIRGTVYWWGHMPVALPFNFGDVITCAAATGVDNNMSVNDVKSKMRGVLDDKSRQTQSEWMDVVPQLEMLDAKDVNAHYKRCAADGGCYVKYERRGGGYYNLVKLDDSHPADPRPTFVIPSNVRLTETPSYPDKNGNFSFKADGIEWAATVYHTTAKCPAFWSRTLENWFLFSDYKSVLDVEKRVNSSENDEPQTEVAENKQYLREAFSSDMTAADFFAKNTCVVYSCTHKEFVKGIFDNGFSRQYANDNDKNHNGGQLFYGDGVYGSVTLGNGTFNDIRGDNSKMQNAGAIYLSTYPDWGKSDNLKYGGVILKCLLLGGWRNFLIFDERLAKAVYKDNWTIEGQIQQIIGKKNPEAALYLEKGLRAYGNFHYNVNSSDSRTTQNIRGIFQSDFKKWTEFFRKYGIRGCVYHGGNDGYAFVCYNYSEVVPVAASYDHGSTWTNKDFDFGRTKERLEFDNDPVSKWGHMFSKMSKFSKKITCNDKSFGVTQVVTKDGKYNLFINNLGKKVSKFDFDAEPSISLNGSIRFKYRGYDLQGTICHEIAGIPAFWFTPTETWYSFDDLDNVINAYEQQKNDKDNSGDTGTV